MGKKKKGKVGRPHLVGNWKPKRKPLYENLTSRWDVGQEAKFFFDLILGGVCSPEKAKADILMMERQRDWLCQTYPRDKDVIERIFQRRRQTWEALVFLMAHPCVADG